jgi:hypothetical protein
MKVGKCNFSGHLVQVDIWQVTLDLMPVFKQRAAFFGRLFAMQ